MVCGICVHVSGLCFHSLAHPSQGWEVALVQGEPCQDFGWGRSGPHQVSAPFGQRRGLRRLRAEGERPPGGGVFCEVTLGGVPLGQGPQLCLREQLWLWLRHRGDTAELSSVPFGSFISPGSWCRAMGVPEARGPMPGLSLTLDERLGGRVLRPVLLHFSEEETCFQRQVEWGCARPVSLGHVTQ